MANHKARTYPALLQRNDQSSSAQGILFTSTPYLGFTGTDQERRDFEYFLWETKQTVGQALNLDHTHMLILQSSHSNDAVRSAVIALGSITERHQVNSILAFDQEQANTYHEFAQAQYHHALKQLREQIANAPHCSENLAVISCFLFTLFEFMQGNDTASMVHLRSGLNMLRRQDGPPDLLRQELLRIFSIMDLQATLWIDLKAFRPSMLNPIIPGSLPMITEHFSDIEDAAIFLSFLTSRVYHFRRLFTNEARRRTSNDTLGIKRDLDMQLEWWPLALERLLVDLGTRISVETLHRSLVMRMNHIITRIAFGACLHEDEERVFRAHLDGFQSIVSLAKTVIRPMNLVVKTRVQRIVAANNAAINPVAVFSFYAGVIQPLYMTAIQCTNVKVCRDAINLLSTPPWQEGAWDSAKMATMAGQKVRQLEKKAIMAMALI